jgi:polysaccharide pyruvyl transferase WcaK-like protein
MRIEICGFYGFGNVGDEAILQAIMQELGSDNEYIISTSLPYPYFEKYSKILNKEIRLHEDFRTDIDAYILGGGGLNFGYGWRQCLSIFAKGVPCMNYAVEYNRIWYYSNKLHSLYREFLKHFNVITLRDKYSFNLIRDIGQDMLKPVLTFDPSIILNEEKFDCPKNKIAVFPRYMDGIPNQPELDWLLDQLELISNDVVLVPCAPRNLEGYPIDLELCQYLKDRLQGSEILEISPFEPRKLKYFISQSKTVYSGGRYHPIVFAIAHNIPFKVSPNANFYPKNDSVVEMYNKYGRDGLIKLANKNKELFSTL